MSAQTVSATVSATATVPQASSSSEFSDAVAALRSVDVKQYLDWTTAPLGQISKGRLAGKVAIVTGASAGIGAVTARRLAAEGAKVVLFARRADKLTLMVNAIKRNGGEAVSFVGDASKESDNKDAVAFALKTYGGLHIAFNNAGVVRAMGQKPWEIDGAVFEDQMAVNVSSVFYGVKHQSQAIGRSGGGVIVNNASTVALNPIAGMALYSATKSWVLGYTKHVTSDLARIGVRINTVSPGFTLSDIVGGGEAGLQALNTFGSHGMQAIGRPVKPEEVAAAVAYLASDDAKPVTGVDLLVDGGTAAQERNTPAPAH